MRHPACISALCTWLLVGAASANADQPLTIVADEWPPFSGEALPGKGISVDVVVSVMRRAGYEIEGEIRPWARIVADAKSGKPNLVGSLFLDPEMEQHLAYADPYFVTSVKFLRKSGGTAAWSDLTSLEPYSIAVGAGFLYEENFDRAETLNKVEVTTTLQGVRMVAHGRVDLTLDSEHVIGHAIRTEDPALADQVEFLDPPLTVQHIHVAVPRTLENHEQIVADFNRVLAEMQADGSLAKLLEKHVN